MEYISFQENNKKENESFIYFLQYTGNEDAINKLEYYVKSADTPDLYGDFSTFEIDTSVKLKQTSVDDISRINLGYYGPTFTVCKGKFNFDDSLFKNLDKSNIGLKLDELYYACRICDYFK